MPKAIRRLGVLGSLCNPPHLWHATLAREASAQFSLERVLLVPTGQPAHRPSPAESPQVRLRLAAAAAADEQVLEVSRVEIERPGPSYMVDTLVVLQAEYPGRELVLLLGADQFAALDRWHDAERLPLLATIAVAPRPGCVDPAISLIPHQRIDLSEIDVSSSLVRERVASGASIADLVSPSVARLIASERLYQRGEAPASVPSS